MGRLIPFGNIPDSTLLPDNIYRLKLEKVEVVMTRGGDDKASKLMYKTTSKVVEPKSHAGLLYFDQFVIGTDADPEAEELVTWQTSFGARNFKKLCAKTGVPAGDEEDEESYLQSLKGAEYLATITQKVEEKEGQYKGTIRNQTNAYWSLGEKEPGSLSKANGHDKSAGRPRPAARPAAEAKPAPSNDVSCSACKKRVPREKLQAHVMEHMREMEQSGSGADANDE